MRFIDRILEQYPDARLLSLLNEAVKLRIQNVADYWTTVADRQHETVNLRRDFPLAVPPWPVMYAEWKHQFRDAGEVLIADCGVLALTERLADRDFATAFHIFRSQSKAAPPQIRGNIDSIIIERRAEADGSPRDELVRPFVSSAFARRLKEAGQTVQADLLENVIGLSGWEIVQPLLLAVTFAHCKNVQTIDRVGNSIRAQSGAGRPDDRWRVLQIDPMRQVLKRAGVDDAASASEWQRAMHICRGHFKTYDESHPLFGKLVGTFWWSAHLRGDSAFGLVEKEYSVKPPSDA